MNEWNLAANPFGSYGDGGVDAALKSFTEFSVALADLVSRSAEQHDNSMLGACHLR